MNATMALVASSRSSGGEGIITMGANVRPKCRSLAECAAVSTAPNSSTGPPHSSFTGAPPNSSSRIRTRSNSSITTSTSTSTSTSTTTTNSTTNSTTTSNEGDGAFNATAFLNPTGIGLDQESMLPKSGFHHVPQHQDQQVCTTTTNMPSPHGSYGTPAYESFPNPQPPQMMMMMLRTMRRAEEGKDDRVLVRNQGEELELLLWLGGYGGRTKRSQGFLQQRQGSELCLWLWP